MKYSVLKSRRKTRKTAIIAFLTILALQGTLQAQYSQYYYHRTGDTIEHDSPVYYHGWWKWTDHQYSKRVLRIGYYNSPMTTDTNLIMLNRHYTPDTLKVIGIAGMRPPSSYYNPTYHDSTEKVHFYVVSDVPHTVLKKMGRSRWWQDAHRKIHIVSTGLNPNFNDRLDPQAERLADCCYDHPLDGYFDVYEYYFDSVVSVVDTFYVGTSYSRMQTYVEKFDAWDFAVDCDGLSCAADKFPLLGKSLVSGWWMKVMYDEMYLVWPIIEIDTTVPPDFVCLPLEGLYVTALDTFSATVAWSDVSSQTTEVQVRYGPTATPNANWRTLTVAGGSRSATLSLPREEFADYAVMVRPLCDSLKTSAAWSDTVFFSLPRDTVGILSPHAAGFTLQPNPATGSVTLTLSESSLPAEVEVVDLSGRTVLARRATSPTLTLPLDGLPAGTYLVRAAGHTRRLVKQ